MLKKRLQFVIQSIRRNFKGYNTMVGRNEPDASRVVFSSQTPVRDMSPSLLDRIRGESIAKTPSPKDDFPDVEIEPMDENQFILRVRVRPEDDMVGIQLILHELVSSSKFTLKHGNIYVEMLCDGFPEGGAVTEFQETARLEINSLIHEFSRMRKMIHILQIVEKMVK